ncbi:MAG: prepilin-type N-terminal cleavage/methylation domain-containing protein [Opitutus sp.]|nr:prepilin-type N-terminal cleavage/methylation domain-containing protein [Opitutus sp.]MCS6274337.1 prepilin-type N-terminal cleavage/methylation domain-containing protein [Opitutus sp.]MCS6278705.1 prepilin-type N-terminal cleavage/methylation domain-containing protein [Opitutus sp.]MCS6299716.1 prepilin-type N-terminal cleavage/methylation domain-containing protein [Opitutus sp.]
MPTIDFKSTGRKGFTLVELMVAIGVTALLVSLMLTITLNVMGGWNKSSGSLTSGNQARLVLDMIARDLQGAVIKKDGNAWLAASIQQNQTLGGDAGMANDASWAATGTIKPAAADSLSIPTMSGSIPPDVEGYRFGQAGTWLRFFTSITDTNTADTSGGSTTDTHVSAPRAVSYQIIRAPVVFGSLEYRYQLFRAEVSSENSFSAGYDLFATAYNSIAPVTETSVSTTIKGAGIIRRPETAANDRRLVIANNVIDFGVRMYTRNTSKYSVQLAFPLTTAKLGFAATIPSATVPAPVPTPAPTSGAIAYDYGIPIVVEVFMRVLTDEGVLQIDNLENGRITGDWWDIAIKNSKVFTRRVELNSAGL